MKFRHNENKLQCLRQKDKGVPRHSPWFLVWPGTVNILVSKLYRGVNYEVDLWQAMPNGRGPGA